MEILLGALISIVSQVLKHFIDWLAGKLNVNVTVAGDISLVLVFVLVLGATALRQHLDATHPAFLPALFTTFTAAISTYEVLLTRVPLLGKRGN